MSSVIERNIAALSGASKELCDRVSVLEADKVNLQNQISSLAETTRMLEQKVNVALYSKMGTGPTQ